MSDFPTIKADNAASAVAIAQQSSSLEKVKGLAAQDVKSDKAKEKAVSGFEALLLHEMFKSMWDTVDTTGFLGDDSNQAQIYRDMLNQSIADSVAKGRGIGVKKLVLGEIARKTAASNK